MRKHTFCPGKIAMLGILLGLALVLGPAAPARACTIFVLTDTNRALFCNNEDWSNPKTRIWFIPAGPRHYGCVFVGFDDGWGQGGLNTEGLAYDWVAGYNETWEPDPSLPRVWGNSSEQMLGACATIEEAVSFYRGHQEPGFFRAKILVADRTGASVIIGARDGKLQVETASNCRGFGYGAVALNSMLAKSSEPTVANGAKILRACAQKGQYATKYSNVYDLKSGDIFLFPFPDRDDQVKLNLVAELKRGPHYYDIPQIHEQVTQALRPLAANMERDLLNIYKPIPDTEPKVAEHLRAMLKDVQDGAMREDDYTAELWQEESPKQKETQKLVKSFGPLQPMTLVDRSRDDGQRSYRYRFEFEKNTLLQYFVFDEHGKLVKSRTEDIR